MQGKLLFFIFLTRNEGTTDESKKRLGCYYQEQLNLPREYSVFDGSQCIVNNRKFKVRQRRESQISNSLTRQYNNFARASRIFVLFFAVNCTATREMPNFTFCEGRKQAITKFILFMNVDMVDTNWVYLGVRTCELFLCFAPFVFLGFIVLTSLFSLFYVTGEFNRFLHRG